MAFDLIGRRSTALAAILLVSAGLSACTTTEGTNAFTDVATFEREVMTSTAQGLGLVPPDVKPDPTNPRGPLVMPKNTASLPSPTEDATVAMLPVDSDKVKIDTTGLTQDDLNRLRQARVVDLNTVDGRPLTDAEVQKLTARMKAARLSGKRSIFTPSAEYFTVAAGQVDLVCLAANGELVSVNDPACPPEIRKALLKNG
ncbi:MAG: hypothetical protein Q7T08_07485 [Devosia sp.]|nr:hypothetical protein [Devosia sp.]